MFSKILKYDFKYMARFWWILAVSALGASAVGAGALKFAIENIDNQKLAFLSVMTMLVGIFATIAVIASTVVTFIFLLVRFYKNFFSDEGYLTFTLPVSRKKLLFSKTLNSFLWSLFSFVLLFICIIIYVIFFIEPSTGGNADYNFLSVAWDALGAWLIVYVFEIILLLISALVFNIVLIEFSVTVGATIARRAKIFVGIAIWYGANALITLFVQMFGIFGSFTFSNAMDVIGVNMSDGAFNATVALAILIIICMVCAIAYVLYCITLSMLERKLNLT